MLKNYEYCFEIKPGKHVFVQRDDAARRGLAYISRITRKYRPEKYFFHFKKAGGHVNAMHIHRGNEFFSHYDLKQFFPSITRTKISRSLKSIGFSVDQSFDISSDSIVFFDRRRFLPYGFVQSNLLATLVLESSALGRFLSKTNSKETIISVYVDDILISTNDENMLKDIDRDLRQAANLSGFQISEEKTQVCEKVVNSFNCYISNKSILIAPHRMELFITAFRHGNDATKTAIRKYIESVNPMCAAILTA